MMDEATIRQKIQEKLQRGALPIHAQPAPEASVIQLHGRCEQLWNEARTRDRREEP